MDIDININMLSMEEEEHEDAFKDAPERRLVAAVMHRALTDLLCDSDVKSQEEARDWIFAPLSDAPELFSFQYICMALDLEPEQVQKAIQELESGLRAA